MPQLHLVLEKSEEGEEQTCTEGDAVLEKEGRQAEHHTTALRAFQFLNKVCVCSARSRLYFSRARGSENQT
jgi:hypothetical protein